MSLGTRTVKSESELANTHVGKWLKLALLWLDENRRTKG